MKVLCIGVEPELRQQLILQGLFLENEREIKTPEDLACHLALKHDTVCLCDFEHLPFNGETVGVLRRRHIDTPLIGLYDLEKCHEPWPRIRARHLDEGMDDALPKPVYAEEVGAMIRAAHRRLEQRGTGKYSLLYGEHVLNVDLRARCFWLDEAEVPLGLSNKETEFLTILVSNPNKLIGREDILNQIYRETPMPDPNSRLLDVWMCNIRNKLDPDRVWVKDFLQSVRGAGYRLNVE